MNMIEIVFSKSLDIYYLFFLDCTACTNFIQDLALIAQYDPNHFTQIFDGIAKVLVYLKIFGSNIYFMRYSFHLSR